MSPIPDRYFPILSGQHLEGVVTQKILKKGAVTRSTGW